MTRGALVEMLVKQAKDYRKEGVLKSVRRNEHMNDYTGQEVSQESIDAILTDFVNYMAAQQGMDLGLYAKDLVDYDSEKSQKVPK